MKNISSISLPACGISIFIFIVLTGCAKIDTMESSDTPEEDAPNLEIFGATVLVTRGDKPMFRIEAPRISRLEQKQLMLFDGGIRVDFFDRDGRHSAVMTSAEGEVLETTNLLTARGNVIVKSDSGMVLLTEELYYEQDVDRVITDGFVTVITENDSLSGVGFSAAPDLSDWVIMNTSGTTWRKMEKPAEKDEG